MEKLWEHPHMDNCGQSIVEYSTGTPEVIRLADHDEW